MYVYIELHCTHTEATVLMTVQYSTTAVQDRTVVPREASPFEHVMSCHAMPCHTIPCHSAVQSAPRYGVKSTFLQCHMCSIILSGMYVQ